MFAGPWIPSELNVNQCVVPLQELADSRYSATGLFFGQFVNNRFRGHSPTKADAVYHWSKAVSQRKMGLPGGMDGVTTAFEVRDARRH